MAIGDFRIVDQCLLVTSRPLAHISSSFGERAFQSQILLHLDIVSIPHSSIRTSGCYVLPIILPGPCCRAQLPYTSAIDRDKSDRAHWLDSANVSSLFEHPASPARAQSLHHSLAPAPGVHGLPQVLAQADRHPVEVRRPRVLHRWLLAPLASFSLQLRDRLLAPAISQLAHAKR